MITKASQKIEQLWKMAEHLADIAREERQDGEPTEQSAVYATLSAFAGVLAEVLEELEQNELRRMEGN